MDWLRSFHDWCCWDMLFIRRWYQTLNCNQPWCTHLCNQILLRDELTVIMPPSPNFQEVGRVYCFCVVWQPVLPACVTHTVWIHHKTDDLYFFLVRVVSPLKVIFLWKKIITKSLLQERNLCCKISQKLF